MCIRDRYVLNMLYTSISDRSLLQEDDVRMAIDSILSQQRFAYQALLYQLTAKQKQLLIAIAQEGKPSSLMSQEFLQKYHLGASTVQGAVKTLLDRDFITQDEGVYQLCDKFLELSLVSRSADCSQHICRAKWQHPIIVQQHTF